MANYDSNYAIAQEISARIGNSPIPFDSVYSICLLIYNELGGEPAQFDSVYEILLGILPLIEGGGSNVIDDTSIRLDKTWSSSKINSEIEAHSGATYTAGQNISIDASNAISADGYIFNGDTNGGYVEKYKQDSADGGQIVANTATGLGSHAEGYKTTASGDYGSHAEGNNTQATGYVSHAEGNLTKASGTISHAEGWKAEASGMVSHAEGEQTKASGNYSHTEGGFTKAIGMRSHAEGEGAVSEESVCAIGINSHVEGTFTQAQNYSEHAQGAANISHKTASNASTDWQGDGNHTLHSIGNGRYLNHKSNAVEVMQNADVYIKGLGGYDGVHIKTETGYETTKTLQDVINGKADVYEVATVDDINLLFRITPPEPTQPNDEIWYTTNNNQAITIDPESVGDYFDKPMLSNAYSDGKGIIKFDGDLTSISGGLSYITEDYDNITSIQLPNSVTSLGYGVFESCSNLVSVKLPTNYTGGIEEQTFTYCSSLESIEIPEGTTFIGDSAFSQCSSLTTATIPPNITYLGYGAFGGCSSLESIICEPITPPIAGGYMFGNTNDCPIYVPAESVNAYKTAEGWTEYAGRIQAIQ